MKKHLSKQLLTAAAFTLILFSCKKSDSLVANSAVPVSTQEQSPMAKQGAAATAAPKVTQITSDFIPLTTFTYDAKGRLSSSTAEYHTTYTYGKGTLTIKTIHPVTLATRSLMTGKINGKGQLVDLTGYSIEDEITQNKKYAFAYDAAGQLVQMNLTTIVEGVTNNMAVTYVWQDGNMIKQTQTYNGNPGLIWEYVYNPAQKDLTGLRNSVIDVWSDSFLGKLNTNHVSSVYISFNGQKEKYSDNSWVFNANGLATSTVATMYSGSYTYTVSSNYIY